MSAAFVHPALLYRDADEYLAGTVPFVLDGLAAGEPVLVAVPEPNLSRLRAAIGDDAHRIGLHDMSVAGRNPGRIIPGVLLAFAAAHAGERVRIIGEPIWAGRSAAEYPACAQHEALINAAFAGRSATILCPYDTAQLDAEWLRDAYRTHPVIVSPEGSRTSPHYGDPVSVAALFNRPLPDPPGHAATIDVDAYRLPAVRRFVADHALRAGLSVERTDDLAFAINELAGNTVEHTDGPGSLAIWTDNGELICQLTDTGHITDALAGRVPVAQDSTRGRGLMLVNHLCDLVRIYTRPGSTTIRLHARR
jgi:anti-sigma regulatory factor (Ser/Thr protein kinase)